MTDETLDKTLVYINSSYSNVAESFNSSDFKFSYNLIEPIKDAMYLLNVKVEILLNTSIPLNGEYIEDGDPIFFRLNDYHKLVANVNGDNVRCFDYISMNLTDKFGADDPPNKNVLFINEITSAEYCANDINTYVINPVEPNFKRVDISLHDKNFKPVPKDFIKKFTILLCVYHNRRKLTRS